jgi:hypothetical protein
VDLAERKSSIFDTMSSVQAVSLFRSDPECALRGGALASFEASSPPQGRTAATFNLAADQPERFMELVECLPPLIQDILIQYYILKRTQSQIAKTLSMKSQSTDISRRLKLGREAICAIIAWGKDPKKMNGHPAAASYRLLLARDGKRKKQLRVRVHRELGKFEVRAADSKIGEFFVHCTQMDHDREYPLQLEGEC